MARVKAAKVQDKVIDEENLIAEFCLDFGASNRVTKEYLDNLINAKQLVRVAGMLMTPEQYEFERCLNGSSDSTKEEREVLE